MYPYTLCRSARHRAHPSAPMDSSVMSRSSTGEIDARPGYDFRTASTTDVLSFPLHTTAPPTGTMKFLSVDWTTASTRPRRHARVTSLHSCAAWIPYALLMTCPTSSAEHILATSEHASADLGAKHEVEVMTQQTFEGPAASTAARTASTSVHSWSPTSFGDTTTSSSPAERTALTQVFWSRRHHTTLFAVFGRLDFMASRTRVRVMPVARGRTSAGPMSSSPAIFIASATRRLVSLLSKDEPAALGCSAATSPERPMPCARFQCLRATSGL